MDFIIDLRYIINKISETNDYNMLYEFLESRGDNLIDLDKNSLRSCIFIILKYTTIENIKWMALPVIQKSDEIISEILYHVMNINIYNEFKVSYNDIFKFLNIKNYPKNFCDCFLNKEIRSIDVLTIASEIYEIDKEKSKKLIEKYKDEEYSYFAMKCQIEYLSKKKRYDFIYDNLDYIMSNFYDVIMLYNKTQTNKKCENKIINYIKCNIANIVRAYKYDIIELLEQSDKNPTLRPIITNYIKDNLPSIIENISSKIDIFDIKKYLDNYEELKETTKNYFNANEDFIIERMYNFANILFLYYEDEQGNNKEKRKTVINILKMIIDEICQKEGITFGDMKKLDEGAFSNVYQINDKVIKLGIDRKTRIIPDNPYIVKPLMRRAFVVDESREYGEQLFIEVTERVIPLSKQTDNIEEIMYDLYSKMRDLGIEWLDVKEKNVGILLKDNIIHWPDNLAPSNKVLGLKDSKNKNDIVLRKGDYVVLDADIEFYEEDFKEKYPDIEEKIAKGFFNRLWLKFHNRYNEEHKIKRQK